MKFICGVFALYIAACASTPFTPEPPEPTPAQMHALLDAPIAPHTLPPPTFHLDTPSVLLEGSAFVIRCYVPRVDEGAIRVGIETVKVTTRTLEAMETDVAIDHAPCGSWLVTCATHTRATPTSPYVDAVRTHPLVVHGLCDGDR